MVILRIEQKVQDYEAWKKVFDNDPINRKKSGVKQYRVLRQSDDPDFIMIDLEFENTNDAGKALDALKKVWIEAAGTIMFNPQTRIFNVVDTLKY